VETAGEKVTVEHDPTRMRADRWLVMHPSGRSLSKGEKNLLASLKRTRQQDIFCETRLRSIPEDVSIVSQTKTTITYGFHPRPNASTERMVAAAMKHARAEVTVSKKSGRVLGGHAKTLEGFSAMPGVKVETYEETYRCAPGPRGASLIVESAMKIGVSAFGKARVIDRKLTLKGLRATP
jgi:hypothetical protein